MNDKHKQLGKFISLVLRHNPGTIGIKLDANGWADVNELITGMNRNGRRIDKTTLIEIVETNDKQRYSFNEEQTKIRANQGHSVSVDVELAERIPPEILYHGTADRFLEVILQTGLQKQNRQHVHLSVDEKTAISVGKRHGRPKVLKIKAASMHQAGHKFYLSTNQVWLTDFVPAEYIEI